ncbi:hypothetical protein [Massilia niabensis]|uniref:DUF1579 domain-containing protein n=1 Tax=Massilia niabensis TaxID=544910 RepID=A0ABW0L3E4_9BURK
MFSFDDFSQLKFLEGRWRGVSADGKEFYEEYVRPEPTVFHSRRYPNASFEQHSDGSTIRLVEGEVVSEWGEFSWRAMEIGPDSARFAPVSAPSEFDWRRIDADTLEAIQRWDADGKPQQYTIRLTRVPPHSPS